MWQILYHERCAIIVSKCEFSKRLTSLLFHTKTPQTKLAEILGTTRQSISEYITGRSLPNAEKIRKIADHFNTSADYLVGRTEALSFSADMISMCNYTGLSEDSLNQLHDIKNNAVKKQIINDVIKYLTNVNIGE